MKRLTFIALLILLIACEPGELVNLPQGPFKITILSFNQVGHPWVVLTSVSKATERYAATTDTKDAVVKIYEDGNFVEQLKFDTLTADRGAQAAVYRSETHSPREGHEYQITVEEKNFVTASATYKQPETVPADMSFDLVSRKIMRYQNIGGNPVGKPFTRFTFNITVTFTDPPGNNYYDFRLESAVSERDLDSLNYYEAYLSSEAGSPYAIDPITLSIDDTQISGKRSTHTFLYYFDADTAKSRSYKMSLRAITEAQYTYIKKIYKTRQAMYDPYAQPVTTFTNVENGLGIFAGSTPYSKIFNFSFEE